MECLRSFRRHFAAQAHGGVAKCRLFSHAIFKAISGAVLTALCLCHSVPQNYKVETMHASYEPVISVIKGLASTPSG